MVKLILIAADTIIFMNTNLVTYLISDLAVNPCDASDKHLPSTVLTVYIWQRCRPVAPVPLYMRLLTRCCMQGANMELWGENPQNFWPNTGHANWAGRTEGLGGRDKILSYLVTSYAPKNASFMLKNLHPPPIVFAINYF